VKDYVWLWFVSEAVGPLYVIEKRQKSELVKNCTRRRGAFGRGCGFASGQVFEEVRYARVYARFGVSASRVDLTPFHDQLVQLFAGKVRKYVQEKFVEVLADETLEMLWRRWFGDVFKKNLPDCAAKVRGGVQQSTVYIENVNRKSRNHIDVNQLM